MKTFNFLGFCILDKVNLKFNLTKYISQFVLNNNRDRLLLSDIKIYRETMVIKVVLYWFNSRQTD